MRVHVSERFFYSPSVTKGLDKLVTWEKGFSSIIVKRFSQGTSRDLESNRL